MDKKILHRSLNQYLPLRDTEESIEYHLLTLSTSSHCYNINILYIHLNQITLKPIHIYAFLKVFLKLLLEYQLHA